MYQEYVCKKHSIHHSTQQATSYMENKDELIEEKSLLGYSYSPKSQDVNAPVVPLYKPWLFPLCRDVPPAFMSQQIFWSPYCDYNDLNKTLFIRTSLRKCILCRRKGHLSEAFN